MIVQKPADVDPAIKSALKNHIMRKRLQLKQELEQDAIEKRLRREQEAKRKQDAMTLDQLKEQLSQLEKTLDNLKNEKHSLFAQLKQNMRVLNEDDTRRKQKEGEMNAARQQQNEQNNRLQTINTNGSSQPSLTNHENHAPVNRDKPSDIQNSRHSPHLIQPQPNNHLEQDTLSSNSHHQQQQQQQQQLQQHQQQQSQTNSHMQRSNSFFNPAAAFTQLLSAHNFPNRQSPYLTHIPPSSRSSNPYGQYPPIGHQHQPSLISGHGIPTSLPHVPQTSPMIRPSPPPMTNNSGQLSAGPPKLPLSLPITSSGSATQLDFNPNLSNSTAHHQMQQHAMNNSAAATAAAAAAALGIGGYGSPYFNSSSPLGQPMSHQVIEQHQAALAAAAAASNHNNLAGNGINVSNTSSNNVVNSVPSSSSRQPMKRPISANDALSPSKKMMHAQPPPHSQPHQLPASLSNPYLPYAGLPPGLASAVAPSLFNQNLMRTPPPPNMSTLFNSAAFSHLFNAHNFPRQPYLANIPQSSRQTSPYGPISSYPGPLGHHAPPSLISGHGIPTSLSHVPQTSPMIRPSPPPMSGGVGQINNGPKLPLSLPITSSGPPQMDFNPNISTSTAHQMQQQAINDQAAAAVAALGLPYGSPYFNSSSPLSQQIPWRTKL